MRSDTIHFRWDALSFYGRLPVSYRMIRYDIHDCPRLRSSLELMLINADALFCRVEIHFARAAAKVGLLLLLSLVVVVVVGFVGALRLAIKKHSRYRYCTSKKSK